jgi:hypothetical protein
MDELKKTAWIFLAKIASMFKNHPIAQQGFPRQATK